MFAVAKKFQILQAVVEFVSVAVMDVMPRWDGAVCVFPDEAVETDARGQMPLPDVELVALELGAVVTHRDAPLRIVARGVKPSPSTHTG